MKKLSIATTTLVVLALIVLSSCTVKEEHAISSSVYSNLELVRQEIERLQKFDNDSSWNYIDKKLRCDFESLEDSMLYYTLLRNHAVALYDEGKIDSALFVLDMVIKFWSRNKNADSEYEYCYALRNYAQIAQIQCKDFQKALNYHNKAIEIAKEHSYTKLLIPTLQSKVILLSNNAMHIEAIESIEEAIKQCTLNADTAKLIGCMQIYASLNNQSGLTKEADKQYIQLLTLKDHYDKNVLFAIYNDKSNVNLTEENFRKAIPDLLKARELWDYADEFGRIVLTNNLAFAWLLAEQPDSMLVHLNYMKSQTRWFDGIPVLKFNYYSFLASYYQFKKNDLEASKAYKKAEEVRKNYQLDPRVISAHAKRISTFYAKEGQYKDAYHELQLYSEADKKVLNENTQKQVSALKYRYQRDTTLMRQQETILQQNMTVKHLSNQQRYLVIIIGLVLVCFIGIFFWWRNSESKKQEILALQHANDIAVLRMENMRNRISPHFMFNVLNSILKNKGSDNEVEKNVKAFINLLQSNLANIDSLGVPLNQELNFVRDFIMLDNLRLESNIEYTEEIEKDVNSEMLVPSMSIHILVENAIKHGLRPKQGKKILSISARNDRGKTIIDVADNGVGRNTKLKTHGVGVGTKVLNQFVLIVNQNNKEEIQLEYIDIVDDAAIPSGTTARLIIPDNLNFNFLTK